MKPNEFGPTIEQRWQACERLVHDVRLLATTPIRR
jgi:hypothetical protein